MVFDISNKKNKKRIAYGIYTPRRTAETKIV
jgi:hypothetical protein